MTRKRGILLAILTIFLIISSAQTLAQEIGCCISQATGCADQVSIESCSENPFYTFVLDQCSNVQTDKCDKGCCCYPDTSSDHDAFRIQCIGEFTIGLTEAECTSKCSPTAPVTPTVPTTNITEPTAPTLPPVVPVTRPREFCGNNELNPYEECDGTIDTKAEGAEYDCENSCGTKDSNRPCKCPFTCQQDPRALTLDHTRPITGEKKIELQWSFLDNTCEPNHFFVERCEGECTSTSTNWKLISDSLSTTTYTDENFQFKTKYYYRIGAVFFKNTNAMEIKYSNINSVEAMDEICIQLNQAETPQNFCQENAIATCNPYNQIQAISQCNAPSQCIQGKCVNQAPCDVCSKPFGFFFTPSCDVSCYKDYSDSSADSYFECSSVESCYDYRSEAACTQNRCQLPPCEWEDSELIEIGIGVCRPTEPVSQNCSKCSRQNPIFGTCDQNLCSLVGETCTFTDIPGAPSPCLKPEDMGCGYYTNQQDCGTQPIQLNENINPPTNKITTKSNDKFQLGTCKWIDRCIKDANNDNTHDCSPVDAKCNTDNIPPQTFVQNKYVLAGGNIEIPTNALDNVYQSNELKTYYALAPQWTYPTVLVQNNKITGTILASGNYILTYYSIDPSNNMEEVKSLNFYIDAAPPSVIIKTINSEPRFDTNQNQWLSDMNITINAEDDTDPYVTCSTKLQQNFCPDCPKTIRATDDLDKQLILEETIHYKDLVDGYYTFTYECNDKSGNKIPTSQIIINIQGDMSVTDPKPLTTLKSPNDIELSVKTGSPATCKYSLKDESYSDMVNSFTASTAGITHTATTSVDSQKSFHEYFVKCQFTEPYKVIQSVTTTTQQQFVNIGETKILFTLDNNPPVTGIKGYYQALSETTWLHDNFELNLECQDPPQQRYGYPAEYGCDETRFCLGESCTNFLKPGTIIITNSTTIRFYSTDKGGNQEVTKKTQFLIDRVPPQINLSITRLTNNEIVADNKITEITYEPYLINIYSSKELLIIDKLEIHFTDDYIIKLPRPFPINDERTHWVTPLLPYKINALKTKGAFVIDGEEAHSWKVNMVHNGDQIEIDAPPTDILLQDQISSIANVEITSITDSNNNIIPYRENKVEDELIYTVNRDAIRMKGTTTNITSLSYYNFTIKDGLIKQPIQITNGRIDFPLDLLSFNSATIPNTLILFGTDTNNNYYFKTMQVEVDHTGPTPSSYQLEQGNIAYPQLIINYNEPVELVKYELKSSYLEPEKLECEDKDYGQQPYIASQIEYKGTILSDKCVTGIPITNSEEYDVGEAISIEDKQFTIVDFVRTSTGFSQMELINDNNVVWVKPGETQVFNGKIVNILGISLTNGQLGFQIDNNQIWTNKNDCNTLGGLTLCFLDARVYGTSNNIQQTYQVAYGTQPVTIKDSIQEYYCANNKGYSITTPCLEGCKDSACITDNPPPIPTGPTSTQSVTSVSAMQLDQAVSNASLYHFKSNVPLRNGRYRFFIQTKDIFENMQDPYAIPPTEDFVINATNLKLYLSSPHLGYSQTKQFDIILETSWEATCQYSFIKPINSTDPSLTSFNETNSRTHTIKGITIEAETPFFVVCDDKREEVSGEFKLRTDTDAPIIISAVAEPPVISQQGVRHKLIVNTNEDTICTYEKTNNPTHPAQLFPGESERDIQTYSKEHVKIFDFDPTPRTETYRVQCTDIATRITASREVTFEVKEQKLSIDTSRMPRYTSQNVITLDFTTNELAECKFQNGTQTWTNIDTPNQPVRNHNYTLPSFPEGTYTININCFSATSLTGAQLDTATVQYTFTIDKTPPRMVSISSNSYSCPLGDEYKIYAEFDAYDNESKIKGYMYQIVSGNNTPLHNGTSSEQAEITDLDLVANTQYSVIASAINGADLISETIKSNPIIAKPSTAVECLEKNPPLINFRVLDSLTGKTVLISCTDESGCDLNSIKYGISPDGNCAPTNPYTTEIELATTTYFCGTACDSVGNCKTKKEKIDVLVGDADKDGILDPSDICPNTPAGEVVNSRGCSDSQLFVDSDGDLVSDQFDQCDNTPSGQPVDSIGCPLSPIVTRGPEPQIIQAPTNTLGWILLILGLLAILGSGGYIIYQQFFMPKPPAPRTPPPEAPARGPAKRVLPFIPLRKLELSKKKGEDLFKDLEESTGGRIWDKLSSFVKGKERDLFKELEKATTKRSTGPTTPKETFKQLEKLTSTRRPTQKKDAIKELKKTFKKKRKKKK